MRVSVCICTYRRPIVVDCIASVLAQKNIANDEMEILVADDDSEHFARLIVEPIARQSSIPIRYLPVGSSNVAICRNACLAAAKFEWIAFIDDDEVAQPDWLAELIASQKEFQAEAIKGDVLAQYPPATSKWIMAGDPFTRHYGATGTKLTYCGAGNILFSRNFVLENDLRFDPILGKSGGEDSVFFFAFSRKGARIVSSSKAIVQEAVPLHRTGIDYLRNRFRGNGSIHRNYFIATETVARRVFESFKSLFLIVVCVTYPIVFPFAARLSFRMFQRFWVHLGMIEATLGLMPKSREG